MTRTQASLSVIAVTLATVTTLFLLPYTPKIPVQTAIVRRGEWTKTTLAEGVAVPATAARRLSARGRAATSLRAGR